MRRDFTRPLGAHERQQRVLQDFPDKTTLDALSFLIHKEWCVRSLRFIYRER